MAYFAIVGTFVPFWSLWLDHRGYSGMQIGVVLGAMAVMRIIAPVVWGWVSDRTGRHDAVMRWGAWGCALLFAAVLIPLDLPALLIAVVAYSIFWNALLPLLERVTLQSLNGDAARYNRVRVWGSLSFIVSVMALGVVFDHLSVAWLPAIVLVQMIVLGACIERLPRARLPERREP